MLKKVFLPTELFAAQIWTEGAFESAHDFPRRSVLGEHEECMQVVGHADDCQKVGLAGFAKREQRGPERVMCQARFAVFGDAGNKVARPWNVDPMLAQSREPAGLKRHIE